MRPALTTVEQDAHVAAAAYLMKRAGRRLSWSSTTRKASGDRHHHETDIVDAVADGKDVNDVRIRDLMTSNLIFCTAATASGTRRSP